MPKITALIHSSNDARRIGRVLDSLRSCDQVLIIDHNSDDDTARLARQHGATVKEAIPGVEDGAYVIDSSHDWILCLLPSESLSEALEASLLEWKEQEPKEDAIGFAFAVREQNDRGWHSLGRQMRLINRKRINWTGALPPDASNAGVLQGDLLRFKE